MTMQYSFRMFILSILVITACTPGSAVSRLPTDVVFSGELSPFPTRTVTQSAGQSNDATLIPTPTPAPQQYTVKKDDFGWTIAAKYNITLAQLQVANPDVDLNFLQEGTLLVIPPPQATPQPILFTPTPVQLGQSEVRCYPAGTQDMWCLTLLSNDLKTSIYYPTGEFLFEKDGQIVSQPVSGLVDILPAGRVFPMIAYIQNRPVFPFTVRFRLKTAVEANQPPVESLPLEDVQVKIDPDGLSARVNGSIVLAGSKYKLVSIAAAAYSQDLAAGVRKTELTKFDPADGKQPFELIVYTVGPRIDRVEVYAEGR